MSDFTDAEWLVFTICVVADTFFASILFAVFVYYKLQCLFSRRGRWAAVGDRRADRTWGKGNWEYSDE